jgi:hypothetical protein
MTIRGKVRGPAKVFIGVTFLWLFSLMSKPSVLHAEVGDDCYLSTDQSWIRIMLYREAPNGAKGAPVWRQPLVESRGETRRIPHGQSGDRHRLHYDYALSPAEELHGDVAFRCENNKKITVP